VHVDGERQQTNLLIQLTVSANTSEGSFFEQGEAIPVCPPSPHFMPGRKRSVLDEVGKLGGVKLPDRTKPF